MIYIAMRILSSFNHSTPLLPLQIEITNDVMFLLPIMVAVMVAKVVADTVTHSLYHAQLELKCVPFLDSEPVIVHEEGDKM